MTNLFSWSLPLGRIFGITVKVHILFLIFIVGMWLRPVLAKEPWDSGSATAMLILMGMVFVSVLLHEFGHCFAARSVDGHADEVLLWPLGGLAFCDVPHTPRANLITAAGGPAVNLLLCLAAAAVLLSCSLIPPLIPDPYNAFYTVMYHIGDGSRWGSVYAPAWNPTPEKQSIYGVLAGHRIETWQFYVGQFFWVNWFLLLLNIVLVGFPMDGGRILQSLLWPRVGYRQATFVAIVAGYVVLVVVGIYGIALNEVLWLCLAGFIFLACNHEWHLLENSHDESLFGYDFSQGYTSLERDEEEPKPRKKKQNFIQRWLARRAQKKLQKETERIAFEEHRMDELLDKIQRQGADSLTDEEQRFLKRVSDRYRNKK